MELLKLSTLPKASSTTGLIYGRPKTGKTALTGTLGSRNVIVNVGHGEETLKSKWFKEKYKGVDPFIVDFEVEYDPRTGVSLGKTFDKVGGFIDTLIAENRADFDHITIDDMTFLQSLAMDKGLVFNKDTGKSKTLDDVVKKHDIIVPAVQDYGSQMSIIKQFLDWYTIKAKELGFNFFVLAHEKDVFKKGDKISDLPVIDSILPYFPGEKMPYEVAGMFDMVVRTEVVGGGLSSKYQLRTVGNEKLMAGIRQAGLFPELISNPDLSKMMDCIKNEVTYK